MDFEYAISFAGPQKNLARDLTSKLKERGITVFFAEDFESEMLGRDGADYLRDVFFKRARRCVALVSRDYEERAWCQLERGAAQAKELTNPPEFLIPVRCDGFTPSWILPTRIHFDLADRSIDELVDLLVQRVKADKKPKVVLSRLASRIRQNVNDKDHRVEAGKEPDSEGTGVNVGGLLFKIFIGFLALVLAHSFWVDMHRSQGSLAHAGVVVDPSSGLMWAQFDSGVPLSWADAKLYCSGALIQGLGGWRLPMKSELESAQEEGVGHLLKPTAETSLIWTGSSREASIWSIIMSGGTHVVFAGDPQSSKIEECSVDESGDNDKLYAFCVRQPKRNEVGYLRVEVGAMDEDIPISINHREAGLSTPQTITLTPGFYDIEVKSSGRRVCRGSEGVDLRPGEAKWVKIKTTCKGPWIEDHLSRVKGAA